MPDNPYMFSCGITVYPCKNNNFKQCLLPIEEQLVLNLFMYTKIATFKIDVYPEALTTRGTEEPTYKRMLCISVPKESFQLVFRLEERYCGYCVNYSCFNNGDSLARYVLEEYTKYLESKIEKIKKELHNIR